MNEWMDKSVDYNDFLNIVDCEIEINKKRRSLKSKEYIFQTIYMKNFLSLEEKIPRIWL